MSSYRGLARLLLAASSLCGLAASPVQAGARIELYTVGPGDYLFSKFGHAALCVVETDEPKGRCYNYGTADFSTPGPLTWAVLRGRAEFWVSVASLDDMLALYRAEDRTIYRQALPLSKEQAGQMAQALALDALPRNRRYRYDHFFDNCSTRPRDHIDGATGGALRAGIERSPSFTFRSLVRRTLDTQPFLFLLTEAFLGRPMDRDRSRYEAMFLPRILRGAVADLLRVAPEVVYTRRAPLPSQPSPVIGHRLALALGIGLAGSLTVLMSPPRVSSVLRSSFACLFGTLGSAAWALAILSPLPELRCNEVLLVFLPADFLLLLGSQRVVVFYAGLRVAELGLVGVLLVSGVLIQPLAIFLALAVPFLCATWLRAVAPARGAR